MRRPSTLGGAGVSSGEQSSKTSCSCETWPDGQARPGAPSATDCAESRGAAMSAPQGEGSWGRSSWHGVSPILARVDRRGDGLARRSISKSSAGESSALICSSFSSGIASSGSLRAGSSAWSFLTPPDLLHRPLCPPGAPGSGSAACSCPERALALGLAARTASAALPLNPPASAGPGIPVAGFASAPGSAAGPASGRLACSAAVSCPAAYPGPSSGGPRGRISCGPSPRPLGRSARRCRRRRGRPGRGPRAPGGRPTEGADPR
jgi:hypothetical protein